HQRLKRVGVPGAHLDDDLQLFFPGHKITLYKTISMGGLPFVMSEAIERSSSSVDIRTSFCFQAAECGTPLRYQGSLALASMQASLSPFSRAAVSTWRRAVAILSASGGRSGASPPSRTAFISANSQ